MCPAPVFQSAIITSLFEYLLFSTPATNMPGPGSYKIPTLSTFAKISHFCNPTTAASTAIIGNNLLWSIILELLENAKVKAFEEGKKLGGKEESENKKKAEEWAYENGWRNGHKAGLEEGREEHEVKYELAYTEGKE